MLLFPFIFSLCGAQLRPLPSSSEKLYVPHRHSICASKQKHWSIFLLLRLAQPAHGVWLRCSPLSFPFLPLSTHHISVLLLARHVFAMAFTSDSFLEGAATMLLLLKRCKPGKYWPLSIELAHFKADLIKLQSLFNEHFSIICNSYWKSVNWHKFSWRSKRCILHRSKPIIVTDFS